MILNKIYMPIEKHTINIIFFPILHIFPLNKNSESKIAMSIIVIAHTIIYLYFEFVNYAVITNGSAWNGLPLSCFVNGIFIFLHVYKMLLREGKQRLPLYIWQVSTLRLYVARGARPHTWL